MIRVAGILVILAAASAIAQATEDELKPQEGPWRIILKEQLKNDKGCDLNEVITFQEVPLGDNVSLDGRISCIDGREFNFTRMRSHQKFSLEQCEPTVC
jgi:hypothetical protein